MEDWLLVNPSLLTGKSQDSCCLGRSLESFRWEHGSTPGPKPLASDPECVLDSPQEEEDRRKGG